MSIPNLTIIGERINPGFASTKVLLENKDLKGLQALAISQQQKGAAYLTINVGEFATKEPEFLREVIRAVQAVADLPISFDYPHASVQEICLNTYDPVKAKGKKPIVNSITELRWDMLQVLKIQPAKVVLMASERVEGGKAAANVTATEVHETARRMVKNAASNGHGLSPDDLYIDVSLGPLATDTDGLIRCALESIRRIGADPELRGVHILVGLSNLGIMLPKTALDGSRLSTKVESAFLTLALPCGLDTVLATAGREYELLPPDDFVLQGVVEAINMEGYDALLRVQQLYRKDS